LDIKVISCFVVISEHAILLKFYILLNPRESNKMRIALFLPSLHGGGLERTMVSLATAFAAEGLAVDLVVGWAGGPYKNRVGRLVNVVDLKRRRLLSCLPPLALYLSRAAPKVMLSTPNQANIVAILARRLAGAETRLVIREASTLSLAASNARNRRGHLRPLYTRLFYGMADAIVAISEGVAADLATCASIDRARISVIYNGIDILETLCEAAEPVDHAWLRPGGPPVILGAGRLHKAKDFPTLIRAFAELRRREEARLIILGEGEERTELQALIRDLGVEGYAELPGFVKNPFAYMARARVFAFSSAWEGFGNVVLEALACGTPVVSTNCPSGPAEILDGGTYGTLVPVGDAAALAAALTRVLEAPADPRSTRQRQERALAFSRAKTVNQYLDVLGVPKGTHSLHLVDKERAAPASRPIQMQN
jgi:glycosyltransferase involved in cell wall biosynthesis